MNDSLGFHFALFQSDTARNRVKVWLDGEANYSFFKPEELINLMHEEGKPTLRRALMDSSFFLWDVDGNKLSRVSFKEDPESLRKVITEHLPPPDEAATAASIPERYFRSTVGLGESNVQISV